MATPRVGIPEIITSQSDKTVTRNTGMQYVEQLCQLSVHDITNTPPTGVNGREYICGTSPTGVWSGKAKNIAYYRNGWHFYVPFEGLVAWVRDENKLYLFYDNAWNSGTIGASTELSDFNQTGVATGDMLRWDGTDWVNEQPTYDIIMYKTSGVPTSSEVLLEFALTRDVIIPASMTNSYFQADVAATAQTDIDVQKNSVSAGTIRFAAAGTVATFIAASPITLTSGDLLTLVAPASADATLAKISGVVAATRS